MYELERYYMDGTDREFFMKKYEEVIKELQFSDEPEAYLMFLRFMEEFVSFHNKVDKNNKTTYDVKIIYNSNSD